MNNGHTISDRRRKVRLLFATAAAAATLAAVAANAPSGSDGLTGVGGGWDLQVDVVEIRRVPDTASPLATY